MSSRSQQVLITLVLLVMGSGEIVSTPLHAGGGAIGMVTRSMDSKLGGHLARDYTALFDGDRLVANDVTIVKLNGGSQVVLAPQSTASFAADARSVRVKLEEGAITLHRTTAGRNLVVEADELMVVPASGYRTLGEVAMLDGSISVKATEGMMYLQWPNGPLQATKGKTVIIPRRTARSPKPAGGAGAIGAGAGIGTAAKVGGIAAGGAGAAVGATSSGGSSSTRAGGSMGMGSMALAGGNAGMGNQSSASNDHEHNPIAVDQVANHVPDQACQHAASPSVPWVACGPGSGR